MCECQISNVGFKCPCKPINFLYDFRKKWNPNDFNVVFGSDGVVVQDSTGLTVTSNPFTFTIPLGNEHVKWLRYYKTLIPLCDSHEVIFEANIAAQQFIPIPEAIPVDMRPRIRNVNDDIRLASAALNLLDQSTWMVFDFFMSNTSIYAFYERLPNGKPSFGGNLEDYAAFSNAIWVAPRSGVDPLSDVIKLAIGIHSGKGIVTWYVNDIPVFSINRIGYRTHEEYRLLDHGGPERIVNLSSISVGFGTFSLLDMALPNNYARNYVVAVGPNDNQREINASALVQLDVDARYRELFDDPLTGNERLLLDPNVTFAYVLNETPNDNSAVKLFGQGAALRIETLRIYSSNKKTEVSSVNH